MKSFKTFLPPPQQYELLKMRNYKNIDDLVQVAKEKTKNGIQQFMIVSVYFLIFQNMLLE